MTKRSSIKAIPLSAPRQYNGGRGLHQKQIAHEVGIICRNWTFRNGMYRVGA